MDWDEAWFVISHVFMTMRIIIVEAVLEQQ